MLSATRTLSSAYSLAPQSFLCMLQICKVGSRSSMVPVGLSSWGDTEDEGYWKKLQPPMCMQSQSYNWYQSSSSSTIHSKLSPCSSIISRSLDGLPHGVTQIFNPVGSEPQIAFLICAAIKNSHRWSALNNKYLYFIVLETGSQHIGFW